MLFKKDKSAIYTIRELNNIKNANYYLSRCRGCVIDDSFRKRRNSDTIFILGSGPSINDMSESDFEIIRQHDSIGFNWWMAHDFVPDFYFFQFSKKSTEILKLYNLKKTDYGKSIIIIRGSFLGSNCQQLRSVIKDNFEESKTFYINEFPIHSRCSLPISDLITFVKNLGIFDFNVIADFTVKWRGTLGLIVSFAYQMGYSKIILCGVDMLNSDHFFDHEKYDDLRREIYLPRPGQHNIETMMSKRYSSNTVAEYMRHLYEHMLCEHGVQMYILSERSALNGVLPIWRRNGFHI